MKYTTHIKITPCKEDDRYYQLVQGIEYPNLLTEGDTVEDAIMMAIDAWSLLCVVYEDKDVEVMSPLENITIDDPSNAIVVEIESEDTDEYRKECDKQEEETIMDENKITGFEIAGRVIRSLKEIKSEIKTLKFKSDCVLGQFNVYDRYIEDIDKKEEMINKYHNNVKIDIKNMRESISKLQELLNTLESTIDSSYECTNKEEH